MFCKYCGAEIVPQAAVCMKCGCPTDRYSKPLGGRFDSALDEFGNRMDDIDRRFAAYDDRQQQQGGEYARADYAYDPAYSHTQPMPQVSPKSGVVTLVLLLVFGHLGAHRFYAGRTGSAIGMLALMVGGYIAIITKMILNRHFGDIYFDEAVRLSFQMIPAAMPFIALFVWWIVDLINVASSKFTDSHGLKIKM